MDSEKKAIERIKIASEWSLKYYNKPLMCTYSGGKDSDVLLELFKRSGVDFEVVHSHTTADAPQTVRHVWDKFKQLENEGYDCKIIYPKQSMWSLIPEKLMPPTRIVRYCCKILKETAGQNRYIATGVRRSESSARSNREEFEKIGTKKTKRSYSMQMMEDNHVMREVIEACMKKRKMVVNPIIDWNHTDVWDYIQSEKIETCELYQRGYDRVGCIGCPIAGKKRWKEFDDFPKYKNMYIHAFERMLEMRKIKGLDVQWKNGEEVFLWWMEDKNVHGQISFEELGWIE